jgi:hypothetical protein
MLASIPLPLRKLAIWLLAFVSPTVYFILLLLANGFHVASNFSAAFYVTLFFVILACAVLVCEFVSWSTKTTLARKIGLMVFTLIGLLLQVGIIVVVLRAILIAVTA